VYHMAGFYVAPEHRGHGIGGDLVQNAMEVIANDCEKMPNPKAICTVDTSHTNLVVQRLFKRMGFEEVGEHQLDTIDGRPTTKSSTMTGGILGGGHRELSQLLYQSSAGFKDSFQPRVQDWLKDVFICNYDGRPI
jgi:hypothetical protein